VAPERLTPDPDPIIQIILYPENYSIEIYIFTAHSFVGIYLQKILNRAVELYNFTTFTHLNRIQILQSRLDGIR
jgi:hypothetical protein